MPKAAKSLRYKSSKRRSPAQKAHTRQLDPIKDTRDPDPDQSPHSDADKENRPSKGNVGKEKARADKYTRRYRNEAKKLRRSLKKIASLEESLRVSESARKEAVANAAQAQVTQAELGALKGALATVLEKTTIIKKQKHALEMRVYRHPEQKARAVKKAVEDAKIFHMKEKGVITEVCRALVRDLVVEGVGVEHVENVIRLVAEAFAIELNGDLSVRSVGRIVLEGGIASDVQVAGEVQEALGITLSGDGTTHKHMNYESKYLHLTLPGGERIRRFLGVEKSLNHTSETQLSGWKEKVETLSVLHRENLGDRAAEGLDTRDFARKITGVNTDHAEDQKKLTRLIRDWKKSADREKRGEAAILEMLPSDLIPLLLAATERAIIAAGGTDKWEALSDAEKAARNEHTYREICLAVGQEKFDALSPDEKRAVELFIWVGCAMHKELNTVKGGATSMVKWWPKGKGPIKMMTKDNAAAAALGASGARTRAFDVSQGGAVKVTSLAGAIFHHKDDKKGQQDTFRTFFEHKLGFTISFPETSNTRYQSHCEAATALIVHLPLYIEFLELVRDKKEKQGFNHMEKNVYAALHDIPTIEELCVLALFSQSVSHPYMRAVRGPGHEKKNALDMGPLHDQVAAFMKRVISNPDLLISPSVAFTTGTVDGKPWDRPEVIYAIQQMVSQSMLPDLRGLTVAFFEGALETWQRFSAEFAPGGDIALASAAERELAWMPTTNDLNEGALGNMRRSKRNAPNMSDHQRNARVSYKSNATRKWIAKLDKKRRIMLRKAARRLDSAGLVKKSRKAQAMYDEEETTSKRIKQRVKQARKDKKAADLEAVQPIRDISLVNDSLSVPDIESQLSWHRKYTPQAEITNLTAVHKKRKAEKLQLLRGAIEVCTSFDTYKMVPASGPVGSDVEIESADGSDEEDD